VRAAREVFSELGYDAATFQAIAIRADLTRPAINLGAGPVAGTAYGVAKAGGGFWWFWLGDAAVAALTALGYAVLRAGASGPTSTRAS